MYTISIPTRNRDDNNMKTLLIVTIISMAFGGSVTTTSHPFNTTIECEQAATKATWIEYEDSYVIASCVADDR